MTRLRAAFERAAGENRAALVAYLTFADPDPETSITVVEAACRAGADVIELGVPFSDPSADGPSIQRAMERALVAGGSLPAALAAVAQLPGRDVTAPHVLVGHYNPIFFIGPPAIADRPAAAADGVVVGSALVDQVAAGSAAGAPARVAALIGELAAAMPRGS